MTQHVIVVKKKNDCIAVPGHRTAAASDEVKITNHTGDTIDLSFPNSTAWSTEPTPKTLNDKDVSTGILASTACGFYPYSIYCHANADYAEGNSHPAFIVR